MKKIKGDHEIEETFAELFCKVLEDMGKINAGIYKIEVSEILGIGMFLHSQPEVAIVRDSEGRCWIIPETDELISRWDIKVGNKLKIKLEQKKTEGLISSASIIK